MKYIKNFYSSILLSLSLGILQSTALATPTDNKPLNTKVYKLAQTAYYCAKQSGIPLKKNLIMVVDFSLPSTEKRLWLIDTKNNTYILHTHVAHGMNSGNIYATEFSDNKGTHESSLGSFVTNNKYNGHHGPSLRIIGLDKGINDLAAQRNVIIHSAEYVTPEFQKKYTRIGRSDGCFAVNPKVINHLIEKTQKNTLIFAYHPDHQLLKESKYLNCSLTEDNKKAIQSTSPQPSDDSSLLKLF